MPSKPSPARSRLGTKLIRITNLYDITVKQVHTYVRGLHRRIRLQAKTIRKLRRKVANLKKQRKVKSAALEQVPEDDADDDVMKALEKAEAEAKAAEPLDVKAFVDDIKKTAQDFDYQNRYIYEPTSGMYYDPETGYYYNAIYGLHYDGQRGCYLKYNEQSGEYEFYSQVMPEEQLEEKKPKVRQKSKAAAVRTKDEPELDRRERHRRRSRSPRRRRKSSRRRRSSSRTSTSSGSSGEEEEVRRRKRRKKDRKVKRKKGKKERGSRKKQKEESEAEEGELEESSSSSGSESERSTAGRGRVIVLDSSSGGGGSGGDEDVATFGANCSDISRKYPPSLRIIVQESNVTGLRKGSLFVVTCKGGSLGREGDHDVIIPDINVSKFHLKFSYDKKNCTYRVLDLGSRNGTLLNGARMAPTMQESDPFPLAHGDVLELNQTRLLCHVHDGAITCAKCEPGLLMRGEEIGSGAGGGGAEDGEKIVNPVSHREGLKMLQKRYGLEEEKYVDPPVHPASSTGGDYTDRAAHRRKTKGSTNEHAKAQVASVDHHIPAENKGFRMLSKLGWSEGQTLGKNEDGLREPIPMVANVGTSGLGSQGGIKQSAALAAAASSTVDERKMAIWLRTQERYQACADVVEEKEKEQDKPEKASLNQQISSENKGFQMLAKLGWSEGETLGKNEDGLKEPIGLLSNVGTSGLGSKPLKKPGGEQPVSGGGREKTIWKKKQEKRKPVVQNVNLFEQSDSE
uniref:Putative glycine rich nucleic binding domain protein n=1 Tax=Culex tarsalis TaxID=7177 RepID=A0A1Q3G2U5_CULTA